MDLSSEIFVLVVACLVVSCIILGALITTLILLPRRDRRLQMRQEDTVTPDEEQTENGEPSSRDIMNQLKRIQKEQFDQLKITLITFAIAIILSSVAGSIENIGQRFGLMAIGLAIFVGACLLYRRRTR